MRSTAAALMAFCLIVAIHSPAFGQVTVTGRVELSVDGAKPSADSSGVVVWLTRLGGSTPSPAGVTKPSQLVQKNKSFSPHLLVIPVGAHVEFPNQDPFFHNVFSLFDGKRFDLGLYEAGSSRSVVFNRPGISYIFCNIHPEMSAVVVALKTPYYGISDRKGAVVIPAVPEGNYEMQIWHERVLAETLIKVTKNVLISGTSSSLGILRLTEQRNAVQGHKNKYGHDYDSPPPNSPIYSRP